ncbi:MAG: hypothetical protein GY789_06865 [Hyphomicrobiales bacterium]|nr:hypothetical protein [Hyphomicrobiales bacterium]MCP5000997.1 hypothetical protein [Hyphomicrobiales bacterium]
MAQLKVWLSVLLLLLPFPAAAETYLLMAEEEGCYWCAKWDEEIAHIYPKTAEGRTAPLMRYDRHGRTPENINLSKPVNFTPTFILIDNGQEVGRIEGYPGEDFFWGLLSMMFDGARLHWTTR